MMMIIDEFRSLKVGYILDVILYDSKANGILHSKLFLPHLIIAYLPNIDPTCQKTSNAGP